MLALRRQPRRYRYDARSAISSDWVPSPLKLDHRLGEDMSGGVRSHSTTDRANAENLHPPRMARAFAVPLQRLRSHRPSKRPGRAAYIFDHIQSPYSTNNYVDTCICRHVYRLAAFSLFD